MHIKKITLLAEALALEKIREMSYADGQYNWTLQLPHFMTEEGLQHATVEHFGDRPDLIRAFNEQHLLTMEEFAASLVKVGKRDAAETFGRLIEDAYRESTMGAALCIPRIVCVGTKPI